MDYAELNRIYQPLEQKLNILQQMLHDLPYRIRTGWFSGHYYRNDQGEWERSSFPIPEVDLINLCDIEIHFDRICVTTKLSRDDALSFPYEILTGYSYETYGGQDYLLDFPASSRNHAILQSSEIEIGFTFSLNFDVDRKEITDLVTLLIREGFYY